MPKNKEIKTFVERGLKTVETLLNQGDFLDAAKACNEILSVDPGNRKAKKFLAKAEKELNQEKHDIFKKNMPVIRKLYKQKQYREAMMAAEKLMKVITDESLIRLYKKSSKALEREQKNEIKEYIKRGRKANKQLKKEGKYLEAINVIEEVLKYSPRNESLRALIRRDKIKYIDIQLHSDVKDGLVESGEYEKLYKFYQKLYFVFPEHKGLLKEIKNAEKLLLKRRRDSNKEFVEASIKKTQEFIAGEKYEDAIRAAKEIMFLTGGESRRGRTLLEKAQHLSEHETEDRLREKLDTMIAQLEVQFKANPKGFVRV